MVNINTFLDNRYQILGLLGEGSSGETYHALDIHSHIEVAIKVLSLRRMGDWKMLELFDREAKILAQLKHPTIPEYLDCFQMEISGEEIFCLVQAIAPGRSLTSWVESGHIFSEVELRDIANQILEILIYLQTFTPPIIHRDLKPQNLLRSESGKIYLVDFGAVRDAYRRTVISDISRTTGCSTIVGTYGYMAPEQVLGQAVLSTDLYGLGVTLLYLRSGQDPADLPVNQMKIDFRERVKLSPDLANWIDRLIEPFPEDRYRNATQALDGLNGNVSTKVPRPKQPIARILQQGEMMKIVIPPIWLATRSSKRTFITATFWLLISIGGWLLIRIAVLPDLLPLLLFLMGIVLIPWMLRVLWHYCTAIVCQREIEIVNDKATFTTKLVKMSIKKDTIILEKIENISCQKVGVLSSKGGVKFRISTQRYHQIDFRQKKTAYFTFGEYLDITEQQWLMNEIFEYLDPSHPKIGRITDWI
jgi:eukaryotic-like serine/threonine-protein kinase